MKAKNLKKNRIRGIETPEAVTVKASLAQLDYIYALIDTSNFTETQRRDLIPSDNITEGEAENLITYLLDNQLCPIECGRNYGQGDIIKKLNQWKNY